MVLLVSRYPQNLLKTERVTIFFHFCAFDMIAATSTQWNAEDCQVELGSSKGLTDFGLETLLLQ